MAEDTCCCLSGVNSLFQVLRRRPSIPERVRIESGLSVMSADSLARPRQGSWASPVPSPQLKSAEPPSFNEDSLKWILDTLSPTAGASRFTEVIADPDATHKINVTEGAHHFLTEQLYAAPGNLPAARTASQREAILRALQPTATFEMMSHIPVELVEASGEEAQALRRKLLEGATIVFFTAGYPGKRFIYERAMQLGVKSVIIEHPDSWAKSLVDEGIIAKFVPIDMSQDAEAVFEQAVTAIRALGKDPLTLDADAIITFCELSVPVVARLAEVLGLPGHPPTSVDRARDKHRTRAEMKAVGLPTPKNTLIKGAHELEEAMRTVGFPAVLKPISGAASLGVKKVSSEAELRESYVEVVTELSKLVVSSGALTQDDGTGKGVKAENAMDCTILMEQYLDGKEVDVDVVMSQGEWRYAAVTDNGPTLEPYFNETYAVCPSLLPSAQQKELKDLAISTLKCLGFTEGIFHVECKYTSHGPHLIEVNARMGGGQVHETNLRVWGVDLVEETLFVAAGIPCRPFIPVKTPLGGGVAYCDINAEESGTLQNLDFLTSLQQKEGVVWARPYIRAGSQVVGPKDGLPTWIAEFLVQRPTAAEALACLQQRQSEVKPDIR
ncbi:CARNS1 [Symbiodinium necroappetens]|uniref:CARNS1 protein n=1 Tax=Symbiodinium necroappetens TaxID=1628268 RepID=A0A812MNM1_9DINO|nr:CARNS1 [Symbiodinium necroappetens]